MQKFPIITLSGKKKFLAALAGLLSIALSAGNPFAIALLTVLYLVLESTIDSKRLVKEMQAARIYGRERLIELAKNANVDIKFGPNDSLND